MPKNREVPLASLTFLLVALLCAPPALLAADPSQDSKEISALLSEARTEALQLQRDASELESFVRSKQLSRQCHLIQLTKVKEQVNKILITVRKLNEARKTGSPRQQEAIEHINPIANELAAHLQATFEHLRDDPGETETTLCSQYREYVTTIYALATKLTKRVGKS